MALNPLDGGLGGVNDTVSIEIDGETIQIVESYEIKLSMMVQPSALAMRIGWSDVAQQMLELCRPGLPYRLFVGDIQIQTGLIDSRAVPGGDSTVVEIKGRDHMRKLINCHVEEDLTFKEKTYFDITRHVMNIVGLDRHKLVAGNGANRIAVTKAKVAAVPAEEQVRVIETGLPSVGGSKMEFKWLRARVGQRWFDWLQEQYRLAGLFLWCAGNGDFVLSTPGFLSEPSYVFRRQRGSDSNDVNILRHSFRDDTTNRHAQYIVYGRFGHGKGGRNKIKGEYVDGEMASYGFTDVITYHEDHISTTAQAEYLAARYAAEERRAGWELSYTLAGHRIPAINGGIGLLGPDTIGKVMDDELGIKGNHYAESVTLSMSPQKEMTVSLIRPADLLYIAEHNQATQAKAKAALQQAKTATRPPSPRRARKGGGATGAWFNNPGATGEW